MRKWEYCVLQKTYEYWEEDKPPLVGTDAQVKYFLPKRPHSIELLGDRNKKPIYSVEPKFSEDRPQSLGVLDQFRSLIRRWDHSPPTRDDEYQWTVEIDYAFDNKIAELGLQGWEMISVNEAGTEIWFKRKVEE